MKIDRKIEKELLKWKNRDTSKPLILRGARQVGKTFIVEEFSKNFSHFVSLNLERPKERELFLHFNSGVELFERILLYKGLKVNIKETLLFIDEIQNSGDAIRSLRYLFEDVDGLKVLAAGSLLEVFSKREGFSFPVGRVNNLFMYPINFREYLECKNPPLAQRLGNLSIDRRHDVHQILLDHFYEYTFVGGMPEALSGYLNSGSYSEIREVYDAIFVGYVEDVEKYSSLAKSKYLSHVIDRAPLYLGTRISYEKFGDSSYKSREMSEAFDTLEKALILYRARPSNSTRIPILEKMRKAPKLFFLDCGLANFRIGFREFFSRRQALNEIYRGQISEQVVAQEIISQGHHASKLYFWMKDKSEAEVDFLYPFKDQAIPIEVKSGALGKLKSLLLFMERCDHPYAVRVYSGENRVDPIVLPSGKKFFLFSMPFYFLAHLDECLTQFISRYKI